MKATLLCSSIYVLTHKVVLSKHIEVKEKNPICLFLLWWWQRLSSAIWKRPATPAAKVSFYRTFWYLSSSVSSSALLSRFFGSWEQKAAASFRSFFVSLATHQKDKRRRKPCDFLQPPLEKVSLITSASKFLKILQHQQTFLFSTKKIKWISNAKVKGINLG